MSRVQINLIPEIKYEKVRSTRKRGLILKLAFLATIILIGIFILLLITTKIIQKKQLSDANGNIAVANSKLTAIPNINQILTIQSQLDSLPNLHSTKHITSRLANYLTIVTPANVKIGRVALDTTGNSLIIGGTTDSQHSVNVFVDTLKFTTYTVGPAAAKPAFPSVVESSFSTGGGTSTYELKVQFDPTLFSNNLVDADGHHLIPNLHIPNLTVTRSAFDDPGNELFNGQYNKKTNQR